MRHAELLAYCLAEPGAVPDTPWDDDPVAKVGGKIFAFVSPGDLGLKCGRDVDGAAELRLRFPRSVTVMRYLGRYGWNSIDLEHPAQHIPDDDELRELIDASYAFVVARLPRRLRPV